MSDVWRADDLVLGIPVALKLMHATTAAGQTVLLNEVRLARRITHPAVCRVFDIGEERGQRFLSMELVEGEDLDTLVHRVGRLPPEKVADIGAQLCDALAAAHAQGILHRDLEPANILIDENGSIRISVCFRDPSVNAGWSAARSRGARAIDVEHRPPRGTRFQ